MAEPSEMLARIDELGRRIDQRVEELQEKGEFSDVHDALAKGLKAAHAKLRDSVGSAAADTTRLKWRGLKDELTRDYNSFVDSVGRFVEHLDADAMKTGLENEE
jgi:hypothetical protein